MYKYDKFWVLFAIGTALVVAGFAYSPSIPLPDGDGILYLLSALSQGLAAIFALVFTITIFGAQMMGKFTSIDQILDKWTKILMIAFSIGIILPLMQLRTDKDLINLDFIDAANLSLAIDLGLATFCVLSIIPYLMRVNKILKYEGGVSKLTEDASEAIDFNRKAILLNRICELVEICESSINEKREHETIKIINIIKNLGKSTIDKGWGDIASDTFDGITKVGIKSIEKKLPNLTIKVINALKEMAIRSQYQSIIEIKKTGMSGGLNNATQSAVEGLAKIADYSTKKSNDDTVSASLTAMVIIGIRNLSNKSLGAGLEGLIAIRLMEVANEVYLIDKRRFKKSIELSLINLWIIGAFVSKRSSELAKHMAKLIRDSNKQVIDDLFNGNEICSKVELIFSIEENQFALFIINYHDLPLELKEELDSFEKLPFELKDELKNFRELYGESDSFTFIWDDILGKHKEKFIKLLQIYGLNWIDNATFEKNNNVIKAFTDDNSLLLKLDDNKTKVILEIDDGRIVDFKLKIDDGQLIFY